MWLLLEIYFESCWKAVGRIEGDGESNNYHRTTFDAQCRRYLVRAWPWWRVLPLCRGCTTGSEARASRTKLFVPHAHANFLDGRQFKCKDNRQKALERRHAEAPEEGLPSQSLAGKGLLNLPPGLEIGQQACSMVSELLTQERRYGDSNIVYPSYMYTQM